MCGRVDDKGGVPCCRNLRCEDGRDSHDVEVREHAANDSSEHGGKCDAGDEARDGFDEVLDVESRRMSCPCSNSEEESRDGTDPPGREHAPKQGLMGRVGVVGIDSKKVWVTDREVLDAEVRGDHVVTDAVRDGDDGPEGNDS